MQEFLQYWLTTHILVDDMAFKEELAGRDGDGAGAAAAAVAAVAAGPVSEPVDA
jgi:hypothetical protein